MLSILVLTLLATFSAIATFAGALSRLGPFRNQLPARSGFSMERLGRRFLCVVCEVLFQTRVIRSKPSVGILHGIVMWGFLAFTGVSIVHLWSGFAGLEHAPVLGAAHRGFIAVWAVAVALAISILTFRRFVLRPPGLGAPSPSSAMISGLIITLMITYLADWAGVFPRGSPSWLSVWWIHTLALMAFPPLIVRSKHLHLVLAPLAIWLRDETTGRMRPLDLDADGIPTEMGLEKFSELSTKQVLDVNACVECGRCTTVCPANRSGSTLDPKRLVLQVQHGLRAYGTLIAGTDDQVADGYAWIREGDLMDCTTCGACEEVCPVGVQHVGLIVDLRHGMVNNDRVTLRRITERLKFMQKPPHSGIPFTKSRDDIVQGEHFPIAMRGTNVLLWLGCGVSANNPEIARSMRTIMDALGEDWGVLAQEICCGETLHQLGSAAEPIMEIAPLLVEKFTALDVRRIIVCDPHCTGMLGIDHRRQNAAYAALGITVIHHAEYIAANLDRLSLAQQDITVAFHDPCKLGRGLGITTQPRDIIRSTGAQLVEPAEYGRRSACCGAGGGQSLVLDERRPKDRRMNYQRFDALVASHQDAIATACPHCHVMLCEAASIRGNRIPIMDIATIVANRLKEKKK